MRASIPIMSVLALLGLSCSGGPVDPGIPDEPFELAPLETIPFAALAEGTFAFDRSDFDDKDRTGIYVIDVEGHASYGFGASKFEPSLSPDGTQFAFTELGSFETGVDVHLMDAHGRGVKRLTSHVGRDISPSWFAGGSRIIYAVNRAAQGSDIYYQSSSVDANDPVLVKSYNLDCAYFHEAISVSPGGVAVYALTFCGGRNSIITLNLDTGEEVAVLTGSTGTTEGEVLMVSPVWSPSGQQIAFKERVVDTVTRDVIRTRIKVMNADGSDVTTIASLEGSGGGNWAGANNNSVVWSPSGSRIAFNHSEGEGVDHIYVVGRDGTGLQRITSWAGASDRSLSWVP